MAEFTNPGFIPTIITKSLWHGLNLTVEEQPFVEVITEWLIQWPLAGVAWVLDPADRANSISYSLFDAVPGSTVGKILVRMKHSPMR